MYFLAATSSEMVGCCSEFVFIPYESKILWAKSRQSDCMAYERHSRPDARGLPRVIPKTEYALGDM